MDFYSGVTSVPPQLQPPTLQPSTSKEVFSQQSMLEAVERSLASPVEQEQQKPKKKRSGWKKTKQQPERKKCNFCLRNGEEAYDHALKVRFLIEKKMIIHIYAFVFVRMITGGLFVLCWWSSNASCAGSRDTRPTRRSFVPSTRSRKESRLKMESNQDWWRRNSLSGTPLNALLSENHFNFLKELDFYTRILYEFVMNSLNVSKRN